MVQQILWVNQIFLGDLLDVPPDQFGQGRISNLGTDQCSWALELNLAVLRPGRGSGSVRESLGFLMDYDLTLPESGDSRYTVSFRLPVSVRGSSPCVLPVVVTSYSCHLLVTTATHKLS